ncbi:hypothetical protein HD806DRAFT_524997 [Xylariaceae sp. AK1471]|nr:hypothetical protein HD806DRAFT_524997 [Xylariaceae sp. AK1471]
MPLINNPTKTANVYRAGDNRTEAPLITPAAKEPDTPPFILGVDTCGFTTGSTLTCDFGYQCTNVDSYRGCCVAGAADCSSTIYTSCLNYEVMPNAAMCGPHTLCCPLTKAYCFSYAFSTEEQPGATFTHVQCAESPGFGELYPYPPELQTTTEDSNPASNTSSVITVEPVGGGNSSSSSSISSGAIAGAVIGAVIFVLLAASGIFLFVNRRRRQRGEHVRSRIMANGAPPSPPTEDARLGNRAPAGRLRPLSTIHERATPSPLSASPGDKRRSASAILRPQSFGPNWPLSLSSSISHRNPLASHPVVDLEKRPGLHDLLPQQPHPQIHAQNRVPILQVPTPPTLGTRLAPPPPKWKLKPPQTSTGGSPTSANGSALQSPRLSYIPVPPIDAAFGEDVEKGLNSVAAPANTGINSSQTAASSTSPLLAAVTSSLETLNANVATNKRLTDNGIFINTSRRSSGFDDDNGEPVSPVSPLDDDGDAPGNQRISLVSAPSALGDTDRGEFIDLVSPISPVDVGNVEGGVSPISVSPLESRRSSFDE